MDLSDVQNAINSAKSANAEATKTAGAKTPTNKGGEGIDKKAELKKEAETLFARGRIMGQGFVTEVLTQADNLQKRALNEGGKVNEGGSKITEQGSLMADGGNALPTSKDNPSKGKIDETGVKHIKEDSLAPHGQVAVNKSESRINKASK